MVVRELITLLGFKLDDTDRKKYDKGLDETITKQKAMADSQVSLATSFAIASALVGTAQKAIGAAFSFITNEIIGATAATERYRVSLGTMIGDQEKANKIIHDLDYSAVSDFYGTTNTIGGLQNLVSFGIAAEDASDILTKLGDVANGNAVAFNSMSLNFGQVAAKGKADAVDLKQFVLQGFDVVGEIAKATGKTRAEIEKAGVSYDMVRMALERVTGAGGSANNMLAKQMNTLGGLIQQFKSFKAATAEAIGFGVVEELKSLLRDILNIGKAVQETFINGFVGAIKTVISFIYQIMVTLNVLSHRIEDLALDWNSVREAVRAFWELVETGFYGLMNVITSFSTLAVASLEPLAALFKPIFEALTPIVQNVFDGIASIINSLVPKVRGLAGIFGGIGDGIANILAPVSGIIDNIVDLIITSIDAAYPVLLNIGNALVAFFEPLEALFTPIFEAVNLAINALKPVVQNVFGLAERITASWTNNIKMLTPIFSKIGNAIQNGIVWAIGLLTPVWDAFVRAVDAAIPILDNLWAAFIAAFEPVEAFLKPIIDALKTIAGDLADRLVSFFGEKLVGVFENLSQVSKSWAGIVRSWTPLFEQAGQAIADAFLWAYDQIMPIWNGIVEAFNAFLPIIDNIGRAFVAAFTPLKAFVTPIIETVKNIIEDLSDRIASFFGEKLVGIFNRVAQITSTWADKIKELEPLFNNIGQVVADTIQWVYDTVIPIVDAIWIAFESALPYIKDAIVAAFEPISTFVMPVFEALKDAISSIGQVVMDIFGVLLVGLFGDAANATNGLDDKVRSLTPIFNTLGKIAGGVIRTLVKIVTGFFNIFIQNKDFLLPVLAAFAAFQGYLFVMKAFQVATKVWTAVQWALNAAMTANPIGLIIAGIAALIAIIVLVIKNWDAVKAALIKGGEMIADFFNELWEGIKSVAESIWNSLAGFFTGIVNSIKGVWHTIVSFFKNLWQQIVDFAATKWNTFKDAFPELAAAIENVWNKFVTFFQNLWKGIIDTAMAVWDGFKNTMSAFVDILKAVWNVLAGFFQSLWQGIVNFALTIWEGLRNSFFALVNGIKNIWNALITFFSGLWEGIANTVMAVWDGLKSWFFSLIDTFKAIWESLKQFFSSLWDAIVAASQMDWEDFKQAIAGIVEAFKMIWDALIGFFKNLWDTIVSVSLTIWESFKTNIQNFVAIFQSIWNALIVFFSTLWQGIINTANAIWDNLLNIFNTLIERVKAVWDALYEFFYTLFESIINTITTMWEGLLATLSYFVALIKETFQALIVFFENLWNIITNTATMLWTAFLGWIGGVVENLKALWDTITEFFSALWEGVVDTAMAVWENLKAYFNAFIEGLSVAFDQFKEFLTGLWEAIKQGPSAVIDFIEVAFTKLFSGLQEKLFGFINKVKEGWESVKGFFSSIGEGVVNFFTGNAGESTKSTQTIGNETNSPAPASNTATKTTLSTAPQSAITPAVSSATQAKAVQLATQQAITRSAQPLYIATGGESMNVNTTMNVSVPAGTQQEQAQSIARQVDSQMRSSLSSIINGSRANIPTAEARRR